MESGGGGGGGGDGVPPPDLTCHPIIYLTNSSLLHVTLVTLSSAFKNIIV